MLKNWKFVVLPLLALSISSCADDNKEVASKGGPLTGVCPSVIKIQTDWFPEAEHGGAYQLLGDNYSVSKDSASVSGPLMDGDTDTGVDVEIIAGGQLSGGVTVASSMYADDSITFGFINTDSQVRDSTDRPTIAVFAPLEKSPLGFMWDASKHPGAKTLEDALAEVDTVAVFGRLAFIEYLIGTGVLPEEKLDLNYNGSLRIATEDIVHQGFSTSEVFQYQKQFDITVGFQSLYDLGWHIYPETFAVRADQAENLQPCLTQLVPILQRAQVSFITEPSRALEIIADANNVYDTWWKYGIEEGQYSVQAQRSQGIVQQVQGRSFGYMEPDRVQQIIDSATPIFRDLGKTIGDLTPEDLIDNSYLDPQVKLTD